MYKISTNGYKNLLKRCFHSTPKMPLMVYGGFGVGKSVIPSQVFKEVAKDMGKKFIKWEETTDEQKLEIISHAGDYFVFCDQRIAQMDTTDLRGIPNMMNTDMLKTIPYSWIVYFTQPKANGLLFFDEINLAPPSVMGSAYQIIHNRTVSDRRIGDGVLIMSAGNRQQDKAHIFQMPAPLRDRYLEAEVEPNLEVWANDFAYENGINPHLISFLMWKPALFYKVDVPDNCKCSTPRGIERTSLMLGDIDITSPEAFEIVSVSVGEAFATEFQAYVKYYSQLNWENIYKNPETVKKFEVDKLWSVAGGMAEQFSRKDKNYEMEQQLQVVLNMPPDFAMVCLNMMKGTDKPRFIKTIKKCDSFMKVFKSNGKYLMDE